MKIVSKICLCFLVGIISFAVPYYSLFAFTQGYLVEGAGSTIVNGQYCDLEIEGLTLYALTSSIQISNLAAGNWHIRDKDTPIEYYQGGSISGAPDADPYTPLTGSSPAPTLTANDCDDLEPPPVLGCTDEGAINFDPEATEDDGSCDYNPLLASVLSNGMHTETYASVIYVFAVAFGLYFMVALLRSLFRPKRR